MKSLWPFKELIEVRWHNPEGAVVAREEVLAFGFCRSFLGFQMYFRPGDFFFRFHSPVKIEIDGAETDCEFLGADFSFVLKKFPKEMKIKFSNHYEIQLEMQRSKNLIPKKWRAAFVASAATLLWFCFLFLFFVNSGLAIFEMAQTSAKEFRASSLDLIEDVAIFQGPSKSEDPSSVNSMSSMMSSWNVGRPLKMLNARKHLEAPQPKEIDQDEIAKAIKRIRTKDLNWTTQEDQPLNISDEVIARAFTNTIPQVQECYHEVLLQDLFSGGSPDVFIGIDQSGRLSHLELKGFKSKKASSEQTFKSCLRDVYRSLELPIPNQAFVVKHQLLLESGLNSKKGS